MGESNADRLARKKRERAEYLKQERDDAELAKKLDADPDLAKSFDDSFVRGVSAMNNEFLEKFAKDKGYSKSETEAMKRTVERAQKVAQGSFFTAGDPQAAEKILMSNRGIREVRKATSEKSCFLAALVVLAGSGATSIGVIWTAVDIATRIFS